MNDIEKTGEQRKELYRAILSLKNEDECDRFLSDLCTVAEINDMANRLAAAKLLFGGCSYGKTSAETGASTATIGRVKRALYYGKDGYRLVIERNKDKK